MPLIFKFTMPLLLGNLLQQTYSLIDAAIVGKFLGISPLAAVGASSSVIFLILGFCNGCCCGFGIPVAQKFGARDYESMRRYVYSSLKLTAWLSVSIAVVTSLLCAAILRWMSTPENIFSDAYWYLLITFIGVPATFYYNLLSSIIRALGDSKTPFWFLLFSTILNIVLDIFCIVTLGWGVAGAAIATVFSQALSAVLCYVYMIRKFDILRASRDELTMSRRHCSTLLKIGVPMGLQFSITAIGSIMLQSANNALGTDCVRTVHRLDAAVGGVMVYAKTAQEAARLTQAMGQGQMQKTYLAVLTGCPAEKAGTLEDLLFHDRVKNKTYVVKRMRGGVKQAKLHYEILARQDGLSLVRIRLETGRTHQIRVQFASRGLPLLGDGKYGSRCGRCTCALWSYRLSFPDGKGEAVFEAQPPAQFPWTVFF